MRIRRIEGEGLSISGLMAGDLRLLEQIPLHADPAGTPSAEERLYQDAIREPEPGAEDEFNDEWREHVVPDLRDQFSRQLDLVSEDVKKARVSNSKSGASFELRIPFEHVEAWYGALNQARLVMQERYNFPELDSPAALLKLLHSPNLQAYLTSRLYVQLQSALIDLAMDRE